MCDCYSQGWKIGPSSVRLAHVTFGTEDSKATKVWGVGANGSPGLKDKVWNGFRYALHVVPHTCSALLHALGVMHARAMFRAACMHCT